MPHRIVRHLGWILWLLDLLVVVAAIVLFTQTPGSNENNAFLGTFSMVIAFFAFPDDGSAHHLAQAGKTVGWIFCLSVSARQPTSFSASFVQYALANHTDTQLIVGLVDILGNTVWPVNLGMGTLLLFLFPTGRLPSSRWRFVFWLDVVLTALSAITAIVTPGYQESTPGTSGPPDRILNPLGIDGAGPLLNAISGFGGLLFVFCALASVAAIIIRYVKSRDIQRQQIKWFALGTAAMVAILVPSFIIIPNENALSNVAFAIGIVMLPLGAGIGVLRYRLFDIDVIINRALVYGLLTAILAGVYFLGVVGVQSLVNVLSGRALNLVQVAITSVDCCDDPADRRALPTVAPPLTGVHRPSVLSHAI